MKTYLKNERGARGENMSVSFANRRMLSLRQNKRSSFPGHAPGKDTLRAANAATKEGANGGENARASVLRSEGVCSPVKSHISSVLFIPSKSRHLPTTFFTAAVSATRNAFVLSSAFMTGQSW